jgi:hypothetical protein
VLACFFRPRESAGGGFNERKPMNTKELAAKIRELNGTNLMNGVWNAGYTEGVESAARLIEQVKPTPPEKYDENRVAADALYLRIKDECVDLRTYRFHEHKVRQIMYEAFRFNSRPTPLPSVEALAKAIMKVNAETDIIRPEFSVLAVTRLILAALAEQEKQEPVRDAQGNPICLCQMGKRCDMHAEQEAANG